MEAIDILNIKEAIRDQSLTESQTVEFKEVVPKDISIIAKIMVSMANSDGGVILIGVSDRKGFPEVIGLKDSDKTELAQRVEWATKHLTSGVTISVLFETLDDKEFAIIEVKVSEQVAYYSKKDSTPERVIEYFKRDKSIITAAKAAYTRVYKYMSLETLVVSLNNSSWRFFEPNKWNDQYEKRFYCAKYCSPHIGTNAPKVYATCVTRERNNEAAWKVYSHGIGMGAHCAQVEIDMIKFRNQLRNSGFKIYERAVKYMSDRLILDLHKKKSRDYDKYFKPFTKLSFLNLISIKRDAYSYENEIRIFAEPSVFATRSTGKKSDYHDFPIKWIEIIKSIRIDSKCSIAELQSLQYCLLANGMNPVFLGGVNVPPLANNPFVAIRQINVEVFNIDEMPGPQRIRIR